MSGEFGDLTAAESLDLKRIFFAQAREISEELQDVLMRVEADPGGAEELKVLKRLLHTLKGDGNSMGYPAIGHLCHRLEDVLVAFAALDEPRRREGLGLQFEGVDELRRLLDACEAGRDDAPAAALLRKIDGFQGCGRAAPQPDAAPALTEYQELQLQDAREHGQQVYEVVLSLHPECGEKGVAALMLAERLAPLAQIVRSVPEIGTRDAEEAPRLTLMLTTRAQAADLQRAVAVAGLTTDASIRPWPTAAGAAAQPAAPPAAAAAAFAGAARSEILRVESARVDRILDLVGELIIGRSMLEQVTRDAESGAANGELLPRLLAVNASLERTVADLHKGVMKMRMVPVQSLFRMVPRMVRDLANARGKRVRLEVHGEETELDKGIVDALGEPLTHLIRNLVDHGIEPPERRRAAGKAEEGTVRLRAYHEGSQIVIEAADDGRGIDTGQLRARATALGLLAAPEAERLSEADALNLVFLSGLSTAASISETSGRGVGMDAVKTAVEAMKGTIEIESAPGRGATFRLRLPLTLAVIKALLFDVGARLYAIPVGVIAEVARVAAAGLDSVDGRPVIRWRERVVPVIDLRALLRIPGGPAGQSYVLILSLGGRRVGLLIDRLLRQQELVVKALDDRYLHANLVAGASILGDGKVVLILDAAALVAKAIAVEREKSACP